MSAADDMATKLKQFVDIGRKIVCVGRNFRAHAAELGNAVPTEPFVFLKPVSAYITKNSHIQLPPNTLEIHHEVELGVVIGSKCCAVPADAILDHIGGYVLALDMTDRISQNAAKKKGLPWTMAKGFDTACPVGDFIPKDSVADPQNVDLWLKVNGQLRQDGNTKDMVFPVTELISWISQRMTLDVGDVVLTGTPEGVGPVSSGDVIECGIKGICEMTFHVKNN